MKLKCPTCNGIIVVSTLPTKNNATVWPRHDDATDDDLPFPPDCPNSGNILISVEAYLVAEQPEPSFAPASPTARELMNEFADHCRHLSLAQLLWQMEEFVMSLTLGHGLPGDYERLMLTKRTIISEYGAPQ